MNVNRDIKRQFGVKGNAVTPLGGNVICENCGRQIDLLVGMSHWINVVNDRLILDCCKDNKTPDGMIMEEGGVFFA